MVRLYGKSPYTIAVVHGGPGALGSVAGLARGLEINHGVLEPIQSKYSIQELVEELKEQIETYCEYPITIIGHSWGAWLVGIFAKRYSKLVKKIILIGSGPLDIKYVDEISQRRMKNMSEEEREEFIHILRYLEEDKKEDKDEYMNRLGKLCDSADSYEKIELDTDVIDKMASDGTAYGKIWSEAAHMRETGELLKIFKNIKQPIALIQGNIDSHPYYGVTEPLLDNGIDLKTIILDKCGHTPWKEKYARKEFFDILCNEL